MNASDVAHNVGIVETIFYSCDLLLYEDSFQVERSRDWPS
jgi:hypothetical protein